jgi:hypothetical protein
MNWTQGTWPFIGWYRNIRILKTNGSIWLAVGYLLPLYATKLASSEDGITWTTIASPFPNNSVYSDIYTLEWNGSIWLLSGISADISNEYRNPFLASSTDGITWTSINISNLFTSGSSTTGIDICVWDGNKWNISVYSLVNNTYIYTLFQSPDAINWTDTLLGNRLSYSYIGSLQSSYQQFAPNFRAKSKKRFLSLSPMDHNYSYSIESNTHIKTRRLPPNFNVTLTTKSKIPITVSWDDDQTYQLSASNSPKKLQMVNNTLRIVPLNA